MTLIESFYLLIPVFMLLCLYILSYHTTLLHRTALLIVLGLALISIMRFEKAGTYLLILILVPLYFATLYRLQIAKNRYKNSFMLAGMALLFAPLFCVALTESQPADTFLLYWLAYVLYSIFFYYLALNKSRHLKFFKIFGTVALIAAFWGIRCFNYLPSISETSGLLSKRGIIFGICIVIALSFLQFSAGLSIKNFRRYPFTYWINNLLIPFLYLAFFSWGLLFFYRLNNWIEAAHKFSQLAIQQSAEATQTHMPPPTLQSPYLAFPFSLFHTFLYGALVLAIIWLAFQARMLYIMRKENGTIF